jgi:prophage regulatory protein
VQTTTQTAIIQLGAQLPDTGFLRLPQIIGTLKAYRPKKEYPEKKPTAKKKPKQMHHYPPLVPVSSATWWNGVKSGRYPPPVKLSPRVTVWKVEDIRALIASASEVPA